METHSSILAWEIPQIEESGRLYSPGGHKQSDMTERLNNRRSSVVHSAHLRAILSAPEVYALTCLDLLL